MAGMMLHVAASFCVTSKYFQHIWIAKRQISKMFSLPYPWIKDQILPPRGVEDSTLWNDLFSVYDFTSSGFCGGILCTFSLHCRVLSSVLGNTWKSPHSERICSVCLALVLQGSVEASCECSLSRVLWRHPVNVLSPLQSSLYSIWQHLVI